jgi:ABC-type proline/glycine betaine transport system permease subunit
MGCWVVLFIIIVILGALNGGDSFGDTISKGIGCVFTIVAIGVLIVFALALFE